MNNATTTQATETYYNASHGEWRTGDRRATTGEIADAISKRDRESEARRKR